MFFIIFLFLLIAVDTNLYYSIHETYRILVGYSNYNVQYYNTHVRHSVTLDHEVFKNERLY